MTDDSGPIPCAIVGAGGYIGQHFARLLADHPRFAPPVLVGSERNTGRKFGELWQLGDEAPEPLRETRLRTSSAAQLSASGVRVVFSALPSSTAGSFETELTRRGVHVFTNAADHRMDPHVPLLVPEVNPEHLSLVRRRPRGRGLLVADPNCTTAGLVVALKPIWRLMEPSAVHVATYQALSGAGFPGVASLAIHDNVVPFIPHEEDKVVEESHRILGRLRSGRVRPDPVPFAVQCARVPVRDGHLEAVTLVSRRRPDLKEITAAWSSFDPLRGRDLPTAPHPAIIVRPEADRPQPVLDRWAGRPERGRGMAVSVGRIRWDPPFLRFFCLSHNAVRGGAGGSVLNAELALDEGWLRSTEVTRG
jgi:aspartate-semialdehyde dehydrogenase